MKNVSYWLGLLALVLLFVVYEFLIKPAAPKTGYVDINKLYAEFQLSKELDAKLKTVQTARKNVLDSLEFIVKSFEQQFTNAKPNIDDQRKYELLQREFSLKQEQFVQDNQQLMQQYQEQIFSQLNQYIQDYSKEKSYDYIFGASGSGSLMATNEKYDLTQAILKYVNKRYAGK